MHLMHYSYFIFEIWMELKIFLPFQNRKDQMWKYLTYELRVIIFISIIMSWLENRTLSFDFLKKIEALTFFIIIFTC